MQRYLDTAWRLRALLAIVVFLVLVPGLMAAWATNMGTFESAATIWVEKASTQYSTGNPADLALSSVSPGTEQAEVLTQLLQTNSFLEEVINQTSQAPELRVARNRERFLGDIRKRFKAAALGTNLIRLSYRGSEPGTAAEMVSGALAARDTRVKAARIAATSTAIAFFQKESELAQTQALKAQRDLDGFNVAHPGRLGSADEYQQSQLRLAVEVAQGRLSDVRQRLERGTVSTALVDMAERIQFQVIDSPRAEPFPSGGLRDASLVAGLAVAGALTLAVGLVLLVTLLSDRVAGPADLAEFSSTGPFGVVPRVAGPIDVRSALAAEAFGPKRLPIAGRKTA
jgi:hypothetical protein